MGLIYTLDFLQLQCFDIASSVLDRFYYDPQEESLLLYLTELDLTTLPARNM